MNSPQIYSKTGKGARALSTKSKTLSPHALRVLAHIDGKSDIQSIRETFNKLSDHQFTDIVTLLETEGYIRALADELSSSELDIRTPIEVAEISAEEFFQLEAEAHGVGTEAKAQEDQAAQARAQAFAEEQRKLEAQAREHEEAERKLLMVTDILAKSAEHIDIEKLATDKPVPSQAERKAQEAAELKAQKEKARQLAKAKAKVEAQEKARIEAERAESDKAAAQAQAKELAYAAAKAEAETKAKLEAETKTRLQAEAQAKLEAQAAAEAAAKRAAEAQAQVEAKAQAEAEARAKCEAEEQAKAEAKRIAREEMEARAQQEAEEKARLAAERKAREEAEAHAIAEAKAKAEAEARAKREAEEQAKAEAKRIAREEAEARARQEAQERARMEAERKAQREAEAHAKAETKAKAAAEAKARREAEAAVKAEAKRIAREEAEARARQAAEAKAQLETERNARKQAKAEIKAQAKLLAKQEAEARGLVKTEARARRHAAREPAAIGKWVSGIAAATRGIFVIAGVTAVALLVLLHFVNLSMLVAPIEKLAEESIGEPVRIKAVHASLWPQPHLVLREVAVGNQHDIHASNIKVLPTLATLTNEVKSIESLEIESLAMSQDALERPLNWIRASNQLGKLKIEQILLKQALIKGQDPELPVFNGKLELGESGQLIEAKLATSERGLSVTIVPRDGHYEISVEANEWKSPFVSNLLFDELNAKGITNGEQIRFDQIEGKLYGGDIKGSMTVSWAGPWNVSGKLTLSKLNLQEATHAINGAEMLKGRLNADFSITAHADDPIKLSQAPEINASFAISSGQLGGVDLARAMQEQRHSVSGWTKFEAMSGNLNLKEGHYRYRQLKLKAGQFQAHGDMDIAVDQQLSGKVDTALNTKSRQLQSHFTLSGKVSSPVLK
ncbi:MAG TPA: AsmA-like C-terminal region-containing protein [Methylophilaceae bacterium]|nr:AsmA-like C-terminal region-containing protein [Methylophilaceae bacterium]